MKKFLLIALLSLTSISHGYDYSNPNSYQQTNYSSPVFGQDSQVQVRRDQRQQHNNWQQNYQQQRTNTQLEQINYNLNNPFKY